MVGASRRVETGQGGGHQRRGRYEYQMTSGAGGTPRRPAWSRRWPAEAASSVVGPLSWRGSGRAARDDAGALPIAVRTGTEWTSDAECR